MPAGTCTNSWTIGQGCKYRSRLRLSRSLSDVFVHCVVLRPGGPSSQCDPGCVIWSERSPRWFWVGHCWTTHSSGRVLSALFGRVTDPTTLHILCFKSQTFLWAFAFHTSSMEMKAGHHQRKRLWFWPGGLWWAIWDSVIATTARNLSFAVHHWQFLFRFMTRGIHKVAALEAFHDYKVFVQLHQRVPIPQAHHIGSAFGRASPTSLRSLWKRFFSFLVAKVNRLRLKVHRFMQPQEHICFNFVILGIGTPTALPRLVNTPFTWCAAEQRAIGPLSGRQPECKEYVVCRRL